MYTNPETSNHSGWAFLIPFILFAVLVVWAILSKRADEHDKTAGAGPDVGVGPAPAPVDPLYDWAAEGDFAKTDVKVTDSYVWTVPVHLAPGPGPGDVVLGCEEGCGEDVRFYGLNERLVRDARNEHYAERHGVRP